MTSSFFEFKANFLSFWCLCGLAYGLETIRVKYVVRS